MFVIRTIRNGRVKIKGRWFYPYGEPKYDGRLDGISYAFGLYKKVGGEIENFVYCWGTASYYYAWGDVDEENWWGEKIPTPNVEPNGTVLWNSWRTIDKEGR